MKEWKSLLRDLVEEQLNVRNGDVRSICDMFQTMHADTLDAAKEDVFCAALHKTCKSIMKALSTDDKQLEFEGISLPSAIAIKKANGDYYYVLSSLATLPELYSGRETRAEHIVAAQTSLDRYDETLMRLRPIMEPYPGMTVAEAIEILERRDEAA